MMRAKGYVLIACGALCARASVAHAQEDDAPFSYWGITGHRWGDRRLPTGIGIGVQIGGGFGGFTERVLRDQISDDDLGIWGVRLSIGTHIPIGVELSYTGLATDLDRLGPLGDGTLIGTTAEGMLRWTVLPNYNWTPYVFAGAGWQRFDITDIDVPLAGTGVSVHDNLAVFPVGAGISYRDPSGVTVDLRGTWRGTVDSDLFRDQMGENLDLDTWQATANIGVEF